MLLGKDYFLHFDANLTIRLAADTSLHGPFAKFVRIYKLSRRRHRATHQILILPWKKNNKLPAQALQQLNLSRAGWQNLSSGFTFQSRQLWFQSKTKTYLLSIRNIQPLDISWFFHIIYLLVIRSGGIPLHAAMLTKGNLAVLISAPGKTGKTTCCLKARLPWRAQCDEQVIITKGKTAFWAHTLPTLAAPVKNSFQAGKTGRAFRLSAIFFLEQSAIDAFIQLSPAEAAGLIYKHIQFKAAKNFITATFNPPQEFEHNKIETACQISKTIPAFILRATLNGNFQKSIEQALRSGKTPRRTPSQMQLYQPKLKVAPPT